MIKKVLGALFFLAALLSLVGSVANGSLFSDQGSAAATYGNFIGTLLPIVIYALSGIFLFTFDNVLKLNYIEGFKKRSKQSLLIWAFVITYGFLVIGAFISVNATIFNTYIDNFFPFMLKNILPYLIPFAIFISFLQIYALPHMASKKYFLNNETLLNEYLSADQTFDEYTNDGFVLASKKALFFPKLYCIVPFDKIESIKDGCVLWERYVYLDLLNQKRITIETKHYDSVMTAINNSK